MPTRSATPSSGCRRIQPCAARWARRPTRRRSVITPGRTPPRPSSRPIAPREDSVADPRGDYDGWHARVAETSALDTPWHRFVQESLDAGRDLDNRRVLEIACGRGELAEWCAAHGRPSLFLAADFSMT